MLLLLFIVVDGSGVGVAVVVAVAAAVLDVGGVSGAGDELIAVDVVVVFAIWLSIFCCNNCGCS